MAFTALKNLRQHTAEPCSPWEWNTTPPAHATVNKAAFDKWRSGVGISHQFYTPFEGMNPHARISDPKPGLEGNPPALLHGVVMDIDQQHTDAAIVEVVNRMPPQRQPQWLERTASGNCRLVWEFEKPLNCCSYDFAAQLVSTFAKLWGLEKTLGGFDLGAFKDPSRYYCNGGVWTRLKTQAHPAQAEVVAVEVYAATHYGWSTAKEWETIPLDRVKEQLMKDPRFTEKWGDAPFEVGARGPTWWVDASKSPDSALVNTKGMYTFSGNAPKNFFPWIDLLGRAFVEEKTATAVSDAVVGIYFDGKNYHREVANGQWRAFGKEDLTSYLKTTRHLSDKAPKNGASDCARALQFIQEHRFIDGAVPVVFRESGLVEVAGKIVLNTSVKAVMPAHPAPTRGWGVDFPYIAHIIDGLFPVGYEGRDFWLSWASVFYRMAAAKRLSSGQNVVIAGGAGKGKTVLGRAILGPLFRGYAECGEFMMGDDGYGGELFENALWTMDDSISATQPEMHRRFSEALKKMAANRVHRVAAKYMMPASTQWMGRVVVTCNDDAKSVQMLPSLDHSVADKLLLLRVPPDAPKTTFLPHDEGNAAFAHELPFFARYLLDWKVPDHCFDPDPRFGGVKAWADSYLVRTATQSSATAPLGEILDDFKQDYLSSAPDATEWRGTSAQLHKELNSNNDRKEAMRSYPIIKLAQQLATLEQQGYPIASENNGASRLWVMTLVDTTAKPEPPILDGVVKTTKKKAPHVTPVA